MRIIIKFAIALMTIATVYSFTFGLPNQASCLSSFKNIVRSQTSSSTPRHRAFMSMVEEKVKDSNKGKVDFSKYQIGQEFEAKLLSAKQFGIFVDIGTNVLLPRSQLSKGNYEKLKKMAETKSAEAIRIELIGVSAENQTLSARYLPSGLKARPDLSSLEGKDLTSRFFNATIISAHDFGVFAELDDFGVEGLIPASRLPEKVSQGSIQSTYR